MHPPIMLLNSPEFPRHPRSSFSAVVRSRRVTASRFSRVSLSSYRTSRCNRTHRAARLRDCDMSAAWCVRAWVGWRSFLPPHCHDSFHAGSLSVPNHDAWGTMPNPCWWTVNLDPNGSTLCSSVCAATLLTVGLARRHQSFVFLALTNQRHGVNTDQSPLPDKQSPHRFWCRWWCRIRCDTKYPITCKWLILIDSL